MKTQKENWTTLDKLLEISNPWFTLVGEHIKDDKGRVLNYWRIEKADSVIILTFSRNYFVLPPRSYRAGLKEMTLDFPGGRIPPPYRPEDIIPEILQRELGVGSDYILNLSPINEKGWSVNSSFSNQKLYGFVAEIDSSYSLNSSNSFSAWPKTKKGLISLMRELTCLQCRALLMEYYMQKLLKKNEDRNSIEIAW
jgi:hypothetical protein